MVTTSELMRSLAVDISSTKYRADAYTNALFSFVETQICVFIRSNNAYHVQFNLQ